MKLKLQQSINISKRHFSKITSFKLKEMSVVNCRSLYEIILNELMLTPKIHGPPGFGLVIVGNKATDMQYALLKKKACDKVGFNFYLEQLPFNATTEDVIKQIYKFNIEETIHGILVQAPLPQHIDKTKVLQSVSQDKDIDGLLFSSVGKLAVGLNNDYSCTPCMSLAVLEVLIHLSVVIAGSHVVIVGNNEVGINTGLLLLRQGAIVTICDKNTPKLSSVVRKGDIVVATINSPRLIVGTWVKKGAVVIDLGQNVTEDPSTIRGWRVTGDVDLESVKQVCSYITPVPGGTGPLTIAMLLRNTLRKYQIHHT